MSKIDCSITENFLKELSRMTNNCHIPCKECAINDLYNRDQVGCADAIMRYPSEAIALVQSWSDAHPIKTRLDDLLEKFPNVPRNEDGYPTICPETLGYCRCGSLCLLHQITCDEAFKKCWNEPLEGGTTNEK